MHYLSKDLCGNILKGITNQGSTNPASNSPIVKHLNIPIVEKHFYRHLLSHFLCVIQALSD